MSQNYACIGHPLGHSMSAFIHEKLFEISGTEFTYEMLDIAPDLLEKNFSYLKSLSGFNITIPHKKAIIPLLDSLDESALRYNAVNCVATVFGKSVGYNTDAYGFLKAIEASSLKLCGNVLILGAGGAAATIAGEAVRHNCKVSIAVRNVEKALPFKKQLDSIGKEPINIINIENINGKYDLLINATPVGMYPDINSCPVSDRVVKNCNAVFDAVYNPQKTVLIKKALDFDKKTAQGMTMLVYQAAKAHKYWYSAEFSKSDIELIIDKANAEMNRLFSREPLILCGFMGSGKTTVGNILSKKLNMPLIDTDALIKKNANMKISEIFEKYSEDYFRILEIKTLHSLKDRKNCIISLGGGTVMREENRQILKKMGKSFFLNVSAKTVFERLDGDLSRPLLNRPDKKQAVSNLIADRLPVYSEFANYIIDANSGSDDAAIKIANIYNER